MSDELSPELADFDLEWFHGNRELAMEMARAYFTPERRANLEPFFRRYTIDGLVALMDAYRERGEKASMVVLEMWIQVEHGPQKIVGHFDARMAGKQIIDQAIAVVQEHWKE